MREDLNRDGKVDGQDKDLDLPRLAPLTYSLGLTHSLPMESWNGMVLTRVDFSHNDDAASDDANLGRLSQIDMLEASLTYASFDGQLRLSLFGKNLLDEVQEGGESRFPANFPGGPFAPDGYKGTGMVFAPLTNEGSPLGLPDFLPVLNGSERSAQNPFQTYSEAGTGSRRKHQAVGLRTKSPGSATA